LLEGWVGRGKRRGELKTVVQITAAYGSMGGNSRHTKQAW
jgi:hypothetical protein